MNDDHQQIQEEYYTSWDGIERFYSFIIERPESEHLAWLKAILDLIIQLRKRGYDRQFRAGQSLLSLILSRSRKHGLRPEQPCIIFELSPVGSMTVSYYAASELIHQLNMESAALTVEVEEILSRLLAHPID